MDKVAVPAILVGLFVLVMCSCNRNTQDSSDIKISNTSQMETVTEYTVGVTKAAINGINPEHIKNADIYIDKNLPDIDSLLVFTGDKLVCEKYYNGYGKDDLHLVCSATKSFTSALVGIAIREGYLKSVDEKVSDLLPEYFLENSDPAKKEITVRHLLTMTAGFQWDELSDLYSMMASKDWIKYCLDKELADTPGSTFNYNSALTQMLSVIITRKSGSSLKEFAEKFLFEPLEISKVSWSKDSQGYYIGGFYMYLTPRDFSKLGSLFLNHGLWNSRQVVPESWVEESTVRQCSGGFPSNDEYGYLWWVHSKGKYKFYYAAGHGGQYIFVIPDLDSVVVFTSNTTPSDPRRLYDPVSVLQNIILFRNDDP